MTVAPELVIFECDGVRRRGRTLDQEVAVVWRLAGERRVEIRSRFGDQGACDRFWMAA